MGIVTAILSALRMAFAMFWEILWALILGLSLSAVVQGRGFEIRDEPALGRRFAENAQHLGRLRRGIVFVFLCRGRACSIDFSQRRQLHGSNGFRAGLHKSGGRTALMIEAHRLPGVRSSRPPTCYREANDFGISIH